MSVLMSLSDLEKWDARSEAFFPADLHKLRMLVPFDQHYNDVINARVSFTGFQFHKF